MKEAGSEPSNSSGGISVSNLFYSPYKARDGWSLQIPNAHWDLGQTHALIGLSGSGKSTLIKIIMGLLRPQRGSVELPSSLQRIGYVVQEGALFPHLNIQENLLLPYRSYDPRFEKKFSAKFKSSEITPSMQERLQEMLSLVALPAELLTRYPHQLSGGQRQRVGIARALILDPNLILLDEPLGALDPITRWDLQRDLKNIFNQLGKTVILISHDMSEALYFGHTVTVMDQGRIVQSASDQEIIKNPANSFVKRLLETRSGEHV